MAIRPNSAALKDIVASLGGGMPTPQAGTYEMNMAPTAAPLAPMASPMPQLQMAPHIDATPKMSKGRIIAGIFADGIAGFLGQQPRVAQQWAREREQQHEEAQWHQRRQAQREDYDYQKQVDQRYRAPEEDQFTRMLRASGVDPHSAAGQALYRQKIDSDVDPIVNVPLGKGQFFSGPKSHLAAAMMGSAPPADPARPAIGAVVADPRLQGGAGSQAPRTFPR